MKKRIRFCQKFTSNHAIGSKVFVLKTSSLELMEGTVTAVKFTDHGVVLYSVSFEDKNGEGEIQDIQSALVLENYQKVF